MSEKLPPRGVVNIEVDSLFGNGDMKKAYCDCKLCNPWCSTEILFFDKQTLFVCSWCLIGAHAGGLRQ